MTASITPLWPSDAPRAPQDHATASLRGTVAPGSLKRWRNAERRDALTFDLVCTTSPDRPVRVRCHAFGLLAISASGVQLEGQTVVVSGDLSAPYSRATALEVEAKRIDRVRAQESA